MTKEVANQFGELDRIIEAFGEQLRDQLEAEALSKLGALEKRVADIENMLARKPVSPHPEPRVPKPQDTEVSLPTPLTFSALDAQLRKFGFSIRDNRGSGGGYWVLDDGNRFKPFAQLLRSRGVNCEFYSSRRRHNGPSFWVDTNKSLPD